MQSRRMSSRARRSPLAACAYAALSLVLLACGDIFSLKQENPGQLSTETLYVPANAQLLTNGAIADFECAFARYVVGSGLLMDELITAIANTANYDYERRTIQSNAAGYGTNTCGGTNQQPGIYTNLSIARAVADTAMAKMEGWTDAEVPNRTRLIGQLAAHAGHPGAHRAAGTVCAGNRFAVVVPCHRVVAAGSLGRYGSLGTAYKRRLLELERVRIAGA
jgi:O-6-methylguanine DNA methyltransferase